MKPRIIEDLRSSGMRGQETRAQLAGPTAGQLSREPRMEHRRNTDKNFLVVFFRVPSVLQPWLGAVYFALKMAHCGGRMLRKVDFVARLS